MTYGDPEHASHTPQPPAQWGWARPQQPMRTVETEPLEYHRLYRGVQGFRWWKTLVMLLLAGAIFGILTVVVSIACVPLLMLDPDYAQGIVEGTGDVLDTQHPVSVLISLVSIIVMIPSVILAMLIMGMRPVGRIWSVAARVRWGLLGRSLGNAVIAIVVMNAVGIGLGILMDPASLGEDPGGASGFDANAALLSLVLIVLLVPFQSVAEELVFRGLFMQVLGSWMRPGRHERFRNPIARGLVRLLNSHWLVIVIPSIAFAAAHIYDVWGLAAVGLMGLTAAWLAWRTGGLEAAIALHIVNNLIAFGFMTAGFGGETAQVEDSGGPMSLVGEVAGLAVFLWLTMRTFRRRGYGRTRIDLLAVPAAPAPQPQPSVEAPAAPRAPGGSPASPPTSAPEGEDPGRA